MSVWASGKMKIKRLKGKQNSESYQQTLSECLLEDNSINLPHNWTFQQDSTGYGIHGNTSTQNWIKVNIPRQIFPWPAQSPDLNVIENCWAELRRSLNGIRTRTVEEFWNAIKREWKNLDQDFIKALVESVPRRLAAVIEAGGGNTKF